MELVLSLGTAAAASAAASQPHTDWWLVAATIVLCVITGALAWFTAKLFSATAEIAKDAAMKSQAQLRAYVTVGIGDSVVQDTGKGINFQGRAKVTNVGLTPAMNATQRLNAAILPSPLPSGFNFPVLEPSEFGMFIGPQQNIDVFSHSLDPIPDLEVTNVAKGAGRAMYFWGVIEYEDSFGEKHETKFCHMVTWPNFPTSTSVYTYFVANYQGMK